MPEEISPQKPERLIEKAFMAAKLAQMREEPCDPTWRWSHSGITYDAEVPLAEKAVLSVGACKRVKFPGIRSAPRPDGWGTVRDVAKMLNIGISQARRLVGHRNRLVLLAPYRKDFGPMTIHLLAAVRAVSELSALGLQGQQRIDAWERLKPPLPV